MSNQPLQSADSPSVLPDLLNYTARQGFMSYQRTLILNFLHSLESILPGVPVIVEFALGDGLFIRRKDKLPFTLHQIQTIDQLMKDCIEQDTPLVRRKTEKKEAEELFVNKGMPDKVELFDFFLDNGLYDLYDLEGTIDWFNMPLLPSAGKAPVFSLEPYRDGVLLRTPKRSAPGVIAPFSDATTSKLYATLKETSDWANRLGIRTAAALNRAIVQGEASELILISEALQEKKIAQIAEQAVLQPDLRMILIAGPSSSGKTSFANRLGIQLKALGCKPLTISVDNYFVNRENSPRNPDGSYNFDTLEAIDIEAFTKDMLDLLEGKEVFLPTYNFVLGKREEGKSPVRLDDNGIIVVEGIFCLQNKLTQGLSHLPSYKIYVSALGQINLDDHNYIRSTDGRLLRRLVRDSRTRGTSALKTMETWQSVRAGEEQNIFPFQNNADVMFNTSALYEWAVLKKYAMPLLMQIPKDSPQYQEAQRLKHLLSAFLSIDNDLVPKNSLVREFIGGSCFNV